MAFTDAWLWPLWQLGVLLEREGSLGGCSFGKGELDGCLHRHADVTQRSTGITPRHIDHTRLVEITPRPIDITPTRPALNTWHVQASVDARVGVGGVARVFNPSDGLGRPGS
eukprot:360849-Chlamydomonas_euryale.AAC.4